MPSDCIALMPFLRRYDSVWQDIRNACSNHMISCTRVKESAFGVPVPHRFFQDLYDCKFVIADLSELRPSVQYELGVAHLFAKPTVLLSIEGTRIPFYISLTQVHFYKQHDSGNTANDKLLSDYLSPLIVAACSKTVEPNVITDALQTTSLIKTSWPWVSGYRRSYSLEEGAETVWIFQKEFFWEWTEGGAFMRLIAEGIMGGKRSYQILLADTSDNEESAQHFYRNLANQARARKEKANLARCFEVRFDSPEPFLLLPCSIVLYNPEKPDHVGILTEPMAHAEGTDPYDETFRHKRPIDVPPHDDLRETTADILLDRRTAGRYIQLFQKRFEEARRPNWLRTTRGGR